MVLELENNALSTLPAELAALTELRHLHIERNAFEAFPDVVSLGITKDELKRQVHHLPPRAFIMSFEDGDLARDGRWADAPARSPGPAHATASSASAARSPPASTGRSGTASAQASTDTQSTST